MSPNTPFEPVLLDSPGFVSPGPKAERPGQGLLSPGPGDAGRSGVGSATPEWAMPGFAASNAGLKQIYSSQAVQSALDSLTGTASDALRSTYEKMLRVGGERFCIKPARMPDFDALALELPNFTTVLDDLRGQIALCMESDDLLRAPAC
jgi:hypothetical protein